MFTDLNIKYPCKPNVWSSSISFLIALSRLCSPPALSLSQSRGITLAVMFSVWCSQLLPVREQKDWNLRCLWMLELDSVDWKFKNIHFYLSTRTFPQSELTCHSTGRTVHSKSHLSAIESIHTNSGKRLVINSVPGISA